MIRAQGETTFKIIMLMKVWNKLLPFMSKLFIFYASFSCGCCWYFFKKVVQNERIRHEQMPCAYAFKTSGIHNSFSVQCFYVSCRHFFYVLLSGVCPSVWEAILLFTRGVIFARLSTTAGVEVTVVEW